MSETYSLSKTDIKVNGAFFTTCAANLSELCAERGVEADSAATALNGLFVPRERRAETPIVAGAEVEILIPMQGG